MDASDNRYVMWQASVKAMALFISWRASSYFPFIEVRHREVFVHRRKGWVNLKSLLELL